MDEPAWTRNRWDREHIDQLSIIQTFIRQERGVVEKLDRGLVKVSQVQYWDYA